MKPKMPAIKPIMIPRNILIARIHFPSAFNSSPVLPPCFPKKAITSFLILGEEQETTTLEGLDPA